MGVCCGGHVVVEDSHADVIHGYLADLALFELQLDFARSGFCPVAVRVRRHALDNARARSSPLVPHIYLHAVIPQLGDFQETPQGKAVALHHAVLAQPDAEARQSPGKSVLAHDGVALDRGFALHVGISHPQRVGRTIVHVLAQKRSTLNKRK